MTKLHTICPKCYSTRIRVKLGAYTVKDKDNNIISAADSFSEVHECPDCCYEGLDVWNGNDSLVLFLKERPWKKMSAKQAEPKTVPKTGLAESADAAKQEEQPEAVLLPAIASQKQLQEIKL